MKTQFLCALAIGAAMTTATTATAATIDNTTAIGTEFLANWFYQPGAPDPNPTVAAEAVLTFNGVAAGIWSFNLALTNTSVDPSGNTRIVSWGFSTDPDVDTFGISATSGVDETWAASLSSPSGNDTNTGNSLNVDNCAYAGPNCNGGSSVGIEMAETAGFDFQITFDPAVSTFELTDGYIRVQSIGEQDGSAKLIATTPFQPRSTPPPPPPPNEVPLPASLPLLAAAFAGLGIMGRRTRRKPG